MINHCHETGLWCGFSSAIFSAIDWHWIHWSHWVRVMCETMSLYFQKLRFYSLDICPVFFVRSHCSVMWPYCQSQQRGNMSALLWQYEFGYQRLSQCDYSRVSKKPVGHWGCLGNHRQLLRIKQINSRECDCLKHESFHQSVEAVVSCPFKMWKFKPQNDIWYVIPHLDFTSSILTYSCWELVFQTAAGSSTWRSAHESLPVKCAVHCRGYGSSLKPHFFGLRIPITSLRHFH